MILNRDIGFVHPSQDAQIKVDAFNFNRYGLIEGKVVSVSPDAIARNKPADKGQSDQSADSENGPANRPIRNSSMPRASRYPAARCKLRTDLLTCRRVWQLPSKSRRDRAL